MQPETDLWEARSLRLPRDLWRRVAAHAKAAGLSPERVCADALGAWLPPDEDPAPLTEVHLRLRGALLGLLATGAVGWRDVVADAREGSTELQALVMEAPDGPPQERFDALLRAFRERLDASTAALRRADAVQAVVGNLVEEWDRLCGAARRLLEDA